MKPYKIVDVTAILTVIGFCVYAGVFSLGLDRAVGQPESACTEVGGVQPDKEEPDSKPAGQERWFSDVLQSQSANTQDDLAAADSLFADGLSSGWVSEESKHPAGGGSARGSVAIAAPTSRGNSGLSSVSSGASSARSTGTAGSSAGGSSGSASGGSTSASSEKTTQKPSSGNGAGTLASTEPVGQLPEWIEREGIRAGFMSSTAGVLSMIPRYVNVAQTIGLNSAIVYGCSFAESPNHLVYYREWLRLCNQAKLHIFVFYPWQPPVNHTCRPVVFSDGTEGLFPCPLDPQLWQKYLTGDMANKLAKISVESPQYSFDGYFLDMEKYRTENEPASRKQYSYDTCFCDFCFSSFLLSRGYTGDTLPPVSKNRRKDWLTRNGYLSDYHIYLQNEVEKRAQDLRHSVHSINPRLLFGVYPALTDSNWVQISVMRGLGRDSYPVISFSTDTYGYYSRPWGADRIPSDLQAYFEKYNINGIYVAGYLLRAYKSDEISRHLIKSGQRAKGYWLFRMPQLVDADIPEFEKLAGGTQADYRRAIREANVYLGMPK